MMVRKIGAERLLVAAAALAATYLFFLEYLRPLVRVHVFSDIEGYHYPLLQFALSSIKQGRFPEWDPTIYCGLSFVGNVQAALFYPPNWVMLALNLGRQHLSFKGLEGFVMLHLWFGFVLCYIWFREKRLGIPPSLLGGAVYAFSGYMMSQANHMGAVTGMTWTPLALWGIDQAVARRDWRPLWKVALASAMCFLAGFPPTWLVFCVVTGAYALASRAHGRAALGTGIALSFSILLFMVQLLPAHEAAALKTYVPKYGSGIKQAEFYAAYFVPNYFDLARKPFGWGQPPGQYLYLGAAALFAFAWLVYRRNLRAHAQALAVAAVSLVGLTNPFNLVARAFEHSALLSQMCHAFNFMEGLQIAAALITAVGIHDFLERGSRPLPRCLAPLSSALLVAWSLWLFTIWLPGGREFAARWASAIDALVGLSLFSFGLAVMRSEKGARRTSIAAVLLFSVFVEYKVFGTSRGFNAMEGDVDNLYSAGGFSGLDDLVRREFAAHGEYRLALDEGAAPQATQLRHYGLASLQGFDPFIPDQYVKLIERYVAFRFEHRFYPRPQDEELMRLTGVRYFITRPDSPSFKALAANPNFRLLEPAQTFFNAFEYLRAEAPYGWDAGAHRETSSVERTGWLPGRRAFRVESASGGRFVLVEQFFPGWRALIDGREVAIDRWKGAFQAIAVAPGRHDIVFEFHSPGLRAGAAVSIAALAVLAMVAFRRG
jgi:hypothetical protein